MASANRILEGDKENKEGTQLRAEGEKDARGPKTMRGGWEKCAGQTPEAAKMRSPSAPGSNDAQAPSSG